ncbi:MAG: fatty acid desaturase [Polyangiaceae bacterium]|nr:fatty acid desaturase [Polyangiaceae bacterium]
MHEDVHSQDPQTATPVTSGAARLLNDPRDLPFIRLILQCFLVALAGVGLFFVREHFWLLGAAYLAVWAAWVLDRYILMLHCTSHRRLFRSEVGFLNQIPAWVLAPFFGQTPESYFVHHLGMHHREGNLPRDTSSTLLHQRDRFGDWLAYVTRFLCFGLLDLSRYHAGRGNAKLLRRLLIGELCFWLGTLALGVLNWRATLVVLVLPLLLVRVLMMIGNWGQHAFVCQEQPENPYRNSITCINTRYNRRCFNDGYHIHHHVHARCHWSEYPAEFEANRAEYGRQDAIVFDGVDFFQVWVLLMLGRWQALARRFVQLPEAPERTEAEVIELLRSRVERFSAANLRALAG